MPALGLVVDLGRPAVPPHQLSASLPDRLHGCWPAPDPPVAAEAVRFVHCRQAKRPEHRLLGVVAYPEVEAKKIGEASLRRGLPAEAEFRLHCRMQGGSFA